MLRAAAVVDDTRAEDSGRRFVVWVVWVQGCAIRRPGCCNPEMFDPRGGRAKPVAALASTARAQDRSVLVFTGHLRPRS